MYSYKARLFSLPYGIDMQVKSSDKDFIEGFIVNLFDLFLIIDEYEKPIIPSENIMEEDLRSRSIEFFKDYGKIIPEINQGIKFINSIKNGDVFFFAPVIQIDEKELIDIHNYIIAKRNNYDFNAVSKAFYQKNGKLIENYTFKSFGRMRVNIGVPEKSHRKCRFCYQSMPKTTFRNKSHAISESLGNKNIILFEECDICNKEISEKIEQDIVEYFSIERIMFKIKGKGGLKELQGANFKMKWSDEDNQLKIHFPNMNDRPDITNQDKYKMRFESSKKIVFQNIYKTLCKFFLSVINSEELINFDKTCKWIMGEKVITNLPKIAEVSTGSRYVEHPEINIFIRKNDDYNLPYAVGEFLFANRKLVFIVPSLQDKIEFLDESHYTNYWNTFFHYEETNWSFNDYSDINPKKFTTILNHLKV